MRSITVGTGRVPVFGLAVPIEVLCPDATSEDESKFESGFWRVSVDSSGGLFRAAGGTDCKILVAKQLKRVPAVDEELRGSLVDLFSREDALETIEVRS
jgi:hypothetical protein